MTKSLKHSEDISFSKSLRLAKTIASRIGKFEEELNEILSEHDLGVPMRRAGEDPFSRIEHIFNRFKVVARQFERRHDSRESLRIKDEYDVQDLLHSLLKIDFDDIREEEYTPSYAGSSARMDFLLKDEQIVIECKKTREGLGAKETSEQIIIDKNHYRTHPNCKFLYCFVYDPDGRITNPRGFERDLSDSVGVFQTKVFVIQ